MKQSIRSGASSQGTAWKIVNRRLFALPLPEPSDVRGPVLTSPTSSWAVFLEAAAVPENGLYHLLKCLLIVGQGFANGFDLYAYLS